MPELAAFFLLGSFVAGLTGALFTFSQLRHYHSERYQTLQLNLGKIGLRWNDLNSGPEDLTEGRFEKEKSRALLTYTMFSAIGVLLSWLGVFLLLMMWVSLKKLVKSRLEREVYRGELVMKELDPPDVSRIWSELTN